MFLVLNPTSAGSIQFYAADFPTKEKLDTYLLSFTDAQRKKLLIYEGEQIIPIVEIKYDTVRKPESGANEAPPARDTRGTDSGL